MRFFLRAGVASASIVLTALTATLPAAAVEPLQATTVRLENGLTVVIQEDHTLPVVALRLIYRPEPTPDALNIVAPRLLLDATKHVPTGRYESLLEAAGGRGLTWGSMVDTTFFGVTLPSHRMDLALWLWSDQMAFPQVDAAKLRRAVDLSLQDRRMKWDETPCSVGDHEIRAALYPAPSPYGAVPIGVPDRIAQAKVEDLERFIARSFVPSNAALVLVGDVSAADAIARVRKWFGDIPSGTPFVPPAVTEPPRIDRVVDARANADAPRVRIDWRIPAAFDRPFQWEAFERLLDSQEISLLAWELRDRQKVVTTVTASYFRRAFGSVFTISATVARGHSAAEVAQAIDALLKNLVVHPPAAGQIEWAAMSAERSRLLERETSAERAVVLGRTWIHAAPPRRRQADEWLDVSTMLELVGGALTDDHRAAFRCEPDASAPIAGVVVKRSSEGGAR